MALIKKLVSISLILVTPVNTSWVYAASTGSANRPISATENTSPARRIIENRKQIEQKATEELKWGKRYLWSGIALCSFGALCYFYDGELGLALAVSGIGMVSVANLHTASSGARLDTLRPTEKAYQKDLEEAAENLEKKLSPSNQSIQTDPDLISSSLALSGTANE